MWEAIFLRHLSSSSSTTNNSSSTNSSNTISGGRDSKHAQSSKHILSVFELVPAYLRQGQHIAYMTRLLTPDMHPPYRAAHFSSNGSAGLVETSGVGCTSVQKLSDGETVYVPLRERLLNKAHISTPVLEEPETVERQEEQHHKLEQETDQQETQDGQDMHIEMEVEEQVMYDDGNVDNGVDMSEDVAVFSNEIAEANDTSPFAITSETETVHKVGDKDDHKPEFIKRVMSEPQPFPLPDKESKPQQPPLVQEKSSNSYPTLLPATTVSATVSEPLPSSSSGSGSSLPAEPKSQKRKRASTAAFCSLLAIGSPKATTPVMTTIPAPTPTSTSHNYNPPIVKRTTTPKVTRIEPAEEEDDDGALQPSANKRLKKDSHTSSSSGTRRKSTTPSRTKKGFSIVESDSSSTSTADGDDDEEGDERQGATAGPHTKHSHQSQQHKGQSQQSMFSPQRRADLRKSAVKSYSNSYYDDD